MKFTHWKNHFSSNKTHFDHIEWNDGYALTKQELKALKSSLQQFQKGENSEGSNLINSAIAFYQNQPDQSYPETIRLFIQEEQSHATALGKFMKQQGIAEIEDHWADKIFRFIRQGKNLERSLLILSCAEIIATEFYVALKNSTNSTTLKTVCEQILIDEENHINFQAYSLSEIYSTRNPLRNFISRIVHFGLLTGTISFVYFQHRKVFKQGGMSFFTFATGCVQEFLRLQEHILRYALKPNTPLLNTKEGLYEASF